MKATTVKQTSCWNCKSTMTFYGHAGLYDFFKCPACGVESAELKDTGDRIATEKPDTPRLAFPGSISGDRWGRQGNAQG